MKKTLFLPLLLLSFSSFSQTVKLINPPSLATPKSYSHAAVIDLGTCTMVIIAGQVAFDKEGNLVGKGDIGKQTEQAFRNIKSILEANGGTMEHLVKLGYFTVDVSRIEEIRNARNQFINTTKPPTSTLVQVSRLFREDLLMEIEATAIIPKK
ncbi:RidA family protein [Chitinophaga niabensis]|uniref:Enamine deaminase RidA, house cleaning of reactive enamine intermediates, YjgF/YER057c/UK114 family n=1 Tax=Chitinophaga niabensis TaxID=536979 RepID=A0A1N6G2P7_9BACT|nr:RidA family protein [Chitinophaga niabensis]SIO01815.1 Enamine deaminase RidA, house cleaning of reactive enamine intermediates, YjgF/YER057c/UK114 family [Chitinophaga niabensis]